MPGIFDFLKKPIQELYIARPEEAANHLIWMHPDRTIPRGAKLKIRSDEVAVFFRNGRVAGTLEAGDYLLDSGNIPFLGELIVDPLTDGNHYLAELFFVRRAEFLQKSGLRKLGSHQDIASGHFDADLRHSIWCEGDRPGGSDHHAGGDGGHFCGESG